MPSRNRQSITILSILLAIITTFFLSIALNNSIIVGTHLALAQQETKVSIVSGASTMADKAYSPNPINVKVRDTVTWTNDDGQAHTVTSGKDSSDPDKGKVFDSSPNFNPLLSPKQTFQHKFTTAGDIPYFCALHPTMVGKVVVS